MFSIKSVRLARGHSGVFFSLYVQCKYIMSGTKEPLLIQLRPIWAGMMPEQQ